MNEVIVFGLRKTKRTPIFDSKGVMVDDGSNSKIVLSSSFDEKISNIFAENIRANVDKKDWKIWVDKSAKKV